MKKRIYSLLPAVFATLVLFLGQVASPAKEGMHEARVYQVNDGDTITLRLEGRKYRTRLIGIDAPETKQRPWGRRAKEHLLQIMRRTNWTVYVETDVERHDKYGRLLVYLWTNKLAFINEMMIADGYAVVFTIEPNTKYSDRLRKAEGRAREERNGIWGLQGLRELPSAWRKEHPRTD
jgi:micrococcal nuclease